MADAIENVDLAELTALERAAEGNAAAASMAPPTWRPHAFVPTSNHEACEHCGYGADDPIHAIGAAIHDVPVEPVAPAPPETTREARAAAEPRALAPDPTLTPVFMAGPDGTLIPLVAASVVAERLAALGARLDRLESRHVHATAILMVLGDKLGVQRADYDRAVAKIVEAERGE